MFKPHNVNLVWRTDDAEKMIVRMARVSAPKNADNMETGPKLLSYLIRHKHWSPGTTASDSTRRARACPRVQSIRRSDASLRYAAGWRAIRSVPIHHRAPEQESGRVD